MLTETMIPCRSAAQGELTEQGFTIVRGAIPASDIAALERDLAPRFDATPFCEGGFYGERTKRFGRLLLRSPRAADLVMHPAILAMAEAALLPWCDRIQLNLTQAIEIHPGALAQFPHRDQEMWQGTIGEIEYLVNIMWPLTPFSPGATMERVYIDLKVRLMTGAYPPGTRLDPRQIARTLDASATPVRDALHRLSGERIVDSWHQEGFRQPLLAEADLAELYEWGGMLLALALKGRSPSPNLRAGLSELQAIEPYPEALDSLFGVIAVGSANRELRYAIVNFIERSRAFRPAEMRIDPASRTVLAAMEEDYRFGRWTGLRSKITSFHRRRMRQAGRIAAAIRPRSDPLR